MVKWFERQSIPIRVAVVLLAALLLMQIINSFRPSHWGPM
jgi:hypothetical protein